MEPGSAVRRAAAAALARASGAIDRGALRLMQRAMSPAAPPPADARARLVDLAAHYASKEMLADPGALFPPPPAAVLERSLGRPGGGAQVHELRFASLYRPSLAAHVEAHAAFAANLGAVARLYRGAARPRPTAICLDGFGAAGFAFNHRAFEIDRLLAHGLDVALLQLPLSGERGGELAGRRPGFPSADLVRTNECFGQAVWDVRALVAALRADGAPAVGVVGMSLGAYVAALTATVEPGLDFAAAFVPAVAMASLMWRHGEASTTRRRAERAGIDLTLFEGVFAVHSPLARPVKLPTERLYISAGRADEVTPPMEAEALAAHWRTEVHWFPGGHLAQVGRGAAFRAFLSCLAALGLADDPRAR